MIQACLNGNRTTAEAPKVPLTPDALASEARAAVHAGAACLHIHPRADEGAETLASDHVAAALDAVRAAVSGIPVGIGTGAWIAPGGVARHADIRDWTVMPDYASLNVHEDDAADVARLLAEKGVAIEAGVWDRSDVPRFASRIDPAACCRILVEIPDLPASEALAEADATLQGLADLETGLPILLHGSDRSAWPVLQQALRLGLDTRIGFEDAVTMPDGAPAPDNAALVRAAMMLA
ncbi:MAG: 3-keto-5-aminohexanoate cleavage protein [Pseudomonadota bacterium]